MNCTTACRSGDHQNNSLHGFLRCKIQQRHPATLSHKSRYPSKPPIWRQESLTPRTLLLQANKEGVQHVHVRNRAVAKPPQPIGRHDDRLDRVEGTNVYRPTAEDRQTSAAIDKLSGWPPM